MNKIFNIILFALFCTSFVQAQNDGKTFEFTYEGQTLKYEVANGNEATVSKQQSEKNSGKVKIPESVTFAGEKYSVTRIGERTFYHCSSLTSVIIPNSVTTIGESAFSYCFGLTRVSIPNSVTTIGMHAFSGCTGLTSVSIPNSVTTIGVSAFFGCEGLTSVTIPNSVTTIGAFAFSRCTGLTSVTIPNSVTTIGMHVFSGCTGLTILTIENATPPNIEGGYAFDNVSEKITIYVPAESVEKYKTANGWSKYADKIKAIPAK